MIKVAQFMVFLAFSTSSFAQAPEPANESRIAGAVFAGAGAYALGTAAASTIYLANVAPNIAKGTFSSAISSIRDKVRQK